MPELKSDRASREQRALNSLHGLAVGDAFGECYFPPNQGLIRSRTLVEGRWRYTDDTNMALGIVACLFEHGKIEQDWLAERFAADFDHSRGYGPAMRRLLPAIKSGGDWRVLSKALFGGEGSFGNGAAMRVSPVGAYFADDLDAVAENARLSAEVTHAHPAGITGAIGIALGAALACQRELYGPALLEAISQRLPVCDVARGVNRAAHLITYSLSERSKVALAVQALGNGSRISAQDTVPYALWSASNWLGPDEENYEEALWRTVEGLGDRDTTCAMVGGIVAARLGMQVIPTEWLKHAEPVMPDAWEDVNAD